MGWLVGGVWIGVGAVALVVLAFCLYELIWKSRRLQRDLAGLTALQGRLAGLQEDVGAVQERLARARETGD